MNPEFNLISVVKSLLKWKWHILIFTILTGVSAVILTVFVMKPYYQSYALVYPVNQSIADRNALFGSDGVYADNYYYGSKQDANRIITIATSYVLTQYIIEKFDLAEHYKYAGKKYEKSNTLEEFMENYTVYKTDKDAIRINLLDTDPELAATIVNQILENIAYETTKPIKANKEEIADLFENEKKEKAIELSKFKVELYKLKPKSSEFELMRLNYEAAQEDYNEIAKLADEYSLASEQSMSGIEIIERAYPAERKLKPVRSEICLATVLIAFILACFGAIGMEQVSYIKEEINK